MKRLVLLLGLLPASLHAFEEIYINNEEDTSLELIIEGEFSKKPLFTVRAVNPDGKFLIYSEVSDWTESNVTLTVPLTNEDYFTNGARVKIKARRFGLFQNATNVMVNIDTEAPDLELFASSPDIHRGAAALLIFKMDDVNPGSVVVWDSFGMDYTAQPFVKEGYFAALVGWSVTTSSYSMTATGEDKAGNSTTVDVEIPQTDFEIEKAYLTFTPTYVEEKVAESGSDADTSDLSAQEAFDLANTVMSEVEKPFTVWDVTSIDPEGMIDTNFSLAVFDPLPGGYETSGFGLLREYYYQGELVKSSYHKGVDLALYTDTNELYACNNGEVVFAYYNGANGNSLVISYGFGLFSIYSHCSEFYVFDGDFVTNGQVVARTGSTGRVTGDHLHFGMLIQGMNTDPTLWMDEDWLNEYILGVMSEAAEKIAENNG